MDRESPRKLLTEEDFLMCDVAKILSEYKEREDFDPGKLADLLGIRYPSLMRILKSSRSVTRNSPNCQKSEDGEKKTGSTLELAGKKTQKGKTWTGGENISER